MQHTINFPNNSKYLEEDYIVTSSNFDAYQLIKNWPSMWGITPYSKSLLVCGPPSSGKTYLANIWQRYANAVFMSSSDNIDQFYQTKPSFIIEDIDKTHWTDKKLLHIFNILHENNKFLMLTCSIHPTNFILPDLTSRLSAVLTTKLHRPDDEMMKIVLMKAFSERSLKVSTEIINYLSSRLTREFSIIHDTVKLIDKYSLEHKRNITIPLLKELLK
ncbi:HdaA/DnaA family protein [Orientia tsutsugamushi]|uniref:DnaA regulatory inactivator Hda n=1 Tax=Orientia tsutsugamushi TaxID=784 RepID=A0A2U3RK08_ORITS|nr:DnaA/Hda family protein [Orientia tsutsugamushi]KJV54651.1 bacterial dnaA family protein [Orientia tsutsugamushi str. Kato PP]SPR13551.1 DnaA regulatory inactivator Hda [Orientia tsutsugamushi]